MYGVKRYGKQFGEPDHWRFRQDGRGQCGDHPVLSAQGLAPEPDKPYGSIRRYGETDVTRVRFVKSAQRLGFSLDEIAELLRLEDGTHCEEASSLAEHKLKDVRERMADLARMEAVLSDLVCACHARKGNVSCPLIASLQGKKEPRSADAV
jgi:MerR family mercuric resistance operon transcriptional regulator